MRTAADFLGMLVYLGVMYGGLPDRELLSAAFEASIEGPVDGGTRVDRRSRQRLRLVKTPDEPAPEATPARSKEATRSTRAA